MASCSIARISCQFSFNTFTFSVHATVVPSARCHSLGASPQETLCLME